MAAVVVNWARPLYGGRKISNLNKMLVWNSLFLWWVVGLTEKLE